MNPPADNPASIENWTLQTRSSMKGRHDCPKVRKNNPPVIPISPRVGWLFPSKDLVRVPDPLADPEKILHVMANFMSDHVGPGKSVQIHNRTNPVVSKPFTASDLSGTIGPKGRHQLL